MLFDVLDAENSVERTAELFNRLFPSARTNFWSILWPDFWPGFWGGENPQIQCTILSGLKEKQIETTKERQNNSKAIISVIL